MLIKQHGHVAGCANAPGNDEAPGVTAEGFRGQQGRRDEADSAARAARDQRDRAFATLRARAELGGYALHIIDEHGDALYLVGRWDRSRTLPDLAAVAAFLDRAGVAHG